MTQPSFYIFGVPNGFDILDGDIDTTSYFQSYYNPSKENTKFSIHRNTGDGGITYAYLKYNMSSGKGREGSFFGMALSFSEKAFCTDILKLYRLFDTIYEKVILADGEILKPTDGTSYIQAKYTITRFSEKKEYIMQRVLSNLLTNLEKFADTFVDCSYTSENPDIGKRVPLAQADNEKLLSFLQIYNRLSISPDWEDPEPPVIIPPELLWLWNQKIKERSLFVNKCYRDLSQVKLSEVKEIYADINHVCERLKKHPYPKGTDSAVLDCYNETYREYHTLKKDYSSLIVKVKEEQGGGGDGTPPPFPPQPPIPPTPWWKNLKLIGVGIAALVIIIILIVGILFAQKHSNTEVKDRTPYIEQKIRTYINQGQYNAALQIAGDSLSGKRYRHFADTIEDIQILRHIDDTLRQIPCYSYVWDLSQKINSKNTKEDKQTQIKNQCTKYLQQKTDEATTKQEAKGAKQMITGCRVPIDSNKKQAMLSKLDGVINPSTGGTGGSSGEGKGGSKPTPSPSTPQYMIKIWKTDLQYKIEGNYAEKEPDYTISTSQTIELEQNTRYSCQILHNGSPFAIRSKVKIKDNSCIVIRDNDWIRIPVKDSGLNNEYIEIKDANLKVTLKTK